MHMANAITTREVDVIQIPSGDEITLPEGIPVTIVQRLGGKFTVATPWGYLVRVASVDADAIGQESAAGATPTIDGPVTEGVIRDQLRTVFDPEIPVNIVELGLIYEIGVTEGTEGLEIKVVMTLTAPGCGMGEILRADVESVVAELPGVHKVDIELTFEPMWTPERMSDAAKLELDFL